MLTCDTYRNCGDGLRVNVKFTRAFRAKAKRLNAAISDRACVAQIQMHFVLTITWPKAQVPILLLRLDHFRSSRAPISDLHMVLK